MSESAASETTMDNTDDDDVGTAERAALDATLVSLAVAQKNVRQHLQRLVDLAEARRERGSK